MWFVFLGQCGAILDHVGVILGPALAILLILGANRINVSKHKQKSNMLFDVWDHLGAILEPPWGHLGPKFDHVEATLRPCWSHVEAIQIQSIKHKNQTTCCLIFGTIFGPSWSHLGTILGPSLAKLRPPSGHLGAILKPSRYNPSNTKIKQHVV